MKRRRISSSNSGDLSRLEALPEELLFHILDLLLPHDLKSLSLASKRLLRLESSHRLTLRPLRLHFLHRALRRFPNVNHLDFTLCPLLPDRHLRLAAASLGSRLLSLDLSASRCFSRHGLLSLALLCPSLRDLDLSGRPDLSDSAVSVIGALPSLRRLSLARCRSVTDVGIGHVAVGCPNLILLSLKGCVGVSDLGIDLVAVKCLHLTSLDLSYLPITNKCLPAVLRLEHLEELSLEGCLGIDDKGLMSIEHENGSLLKTLNLSSCQPTISGLSFLANAAVNLNQLHLSHCSPIVESLANNLKKLSNLHSIKLDGCQVTSLGLKTIATSSIQLKELSLRWCPGVTDESLSVLVGKHKELMKLDITCCRNITRISIANITASCTSLTSLNMESCNFVSKDAFLLIGQRCPDLEELDLTDTELDDEGVFMDLLCCEGLKAISRCSKLCTLKAGICMNLGDKGLLHIGKHCNKLRELDLYRSVGVTDRGLMAVASGCPELQTVNVAYCIEITDNALRSLSGCSMLRTLEMRGCPQVTSEGISAIASCKLISKIDVKKCHNIDDTGFLSLARFSHNLREINLAYCSITDMGMLALSSISCLQYINALHARSLTPNGLMATLLACGGLTKVKLHSSLKSVLPQHGIDHMQARGCIFQWKDGPFEVEVQCSKIWKQQLQDVRDAY